MNVVTHAGQASRGLAAFIATAMVFVAIIAAGCRSDDARKGPEGGICEAHTACEGASAARCRDGQEARLYGRDQFAGGTCVAGGDGDGCRRGTLTCRYFGQCANPEARRGTRPAHCAGDRVDPDHMAANDPACAGFGTCIAAGDAPCRASGLCAVEGRCVSGGGVCIAGSAEDCRNSNHCGSIGWCQRVELPVGPRCRAGGDADCRASATCANLGHCAVRGGDCVACERSDGCLRDGRCSVEGDRCLALTDADCRRSEACRSDRRCVAQRGACVR